MRVGDKVGNLGQRLLSAVTKPLPLDVDLSQKNPSQTQYDEKAKSLPCHATTQNPAEDDRNSQCCEDRGDDTFCR